MKISRQKMDNNVILGFHDDRMSKRVIIRCWYGLTHAPDVSISYTNRLQDECVGQSLFLKGICDVTEIAQNGKCFVKIKFPPGFRSWRKSRNGRHRPTERRLIGPPGTVRLCGIGATLVRPAQVSSAHGGDGTDWHLQAEEDRPGEVRIRSRWERGGLHRGTVPEGIRSHHTGAHE